jgi:5-methylcytosine-specific restriction enzyme B
MPEDLRTDAGLRAACETIGALDRWGGEGPDWVSRLAETLGFIQAANEDERASREFQERLWDRNHVAAVGQGNIRIDAALADDGFRRWLASRSMRPLPDSFEERVQFLSGLYEEIKARLEPFDLAAVPHLKIFRVMAALYPGAMTTVASSGMLDKLTRAMGAERRLAPAERHAWVRERVDRVLGPPGPDAASLAERMALAWMLYERFVHTPADGTVLPPVTAVPRGPNDTPMLAPLPAARRRRGMTAIRGLFPGVLSTLEAIRDGATRDELLDVLRAASPEAKTSSLGVTINVLQNELAVIKAQGQRYVLTERGEDVLESQDPSHLADWLLTRILGADKALVELRDRRALPTLELTTAIRAMNPGWTTHFAPQAIVSWFRSMGVIETFENRHRLTARGQDWASRIDWEPEPLPKDIGEPPTGPGVLPVPIRLPSLPTIVASVQQAGHFPAELVVRLHAGLWSHARRHFAILTGLSGSGKTLLAREYAKALAGGNGEPQLLTVPVQPGWYDPGALFGYINPLRDDAYVRTPFLEFLIAAGGDPVNPYVVVLDEMNLSHPEQYMAPLLSAMETGEPMQLHAEGDLFDGVPPRLAYPSNLVLIGTVNMDETTHGLSDKVLDRAFVLEFWDVDLDAYPRWGSRRLAASNEAQAREVLGALMGALSPARLHFGWRVVDDVLAFLEHADTAVDAMPFGAALDAVVYAKILPKLRGEDSPRLRDALTRCEAALVSFGLRQAAAKVAELRRDLETTGSARFWR